MKTSTKANWPAYLLFIRHVIFSKRKLFISSVAFISLLSAASAQTWESVLAKTGSNGKLVYTTDANKNSLPDFSYAGYKNNDKAIPQVTKIITTLSPKSGDNTSYINSAITAAASVTPDADGIRGVILLSKGTYQINGTIKVNVSGVVLRGAGSSSDPNVGTILQAVGNTPAQRTVLTAGGGSGAGWNKTGSYQSNITDNFVQVGAREFSVASTSGLQVGDNIAIYSPCTSAWISAVGGGGTAGAADWTVGSQPLVFSRVIKAINGLKITIDAPVFNHLNKSLAQAYIYKIDRSGILTQIGLENFSIDIRNWTNQDVDENHAWEGVGMVQIEDSWATNVIALHFGHAGFHFNTASRITLDNCKAMEPVATITPERRYNYNFEDHSTNILIKNSEANKARHAFVSNGTSTVSGVVILRCKASDNYTSAEGHRRWTMGMLFDNYTTSGAIPSDGRVLGLYSRGNYGTSHGWAAVHSIAWNCNVANGSITVQQPPTAQNYVIGGSGNLNTSVPFPQYAKGYAEGFNRTDGKKLSPQSLFDRQLADRQTITPPPNQLPTITLTAPANNQSFTAPASITITADATDADGTVSKVDFYNGTTLLGTDNSAPYSFTWTNVAAGNYTITAKVTDNATAVSTSSVANIAVIAVPVCQTVSSSGDDGNVAANVLDNNLATRWSASGDGQWLAFCLGTSQSVSGVQIAFYSGNTRQSIFDIQVSGDGIAWNTVSSTIHSSGSSLALETFALTTLQNVQYVRILGHGNTVNAWNSYTEVKIIVGTIPVINKAPTASITSPANNDAYNAPAIVTINASAADTDGTVAKVDFYNGTTLLGSDASAPYSYTWMNVAAGTYSLTVKATDNEGATTTSSVITVKVNTVVTNNCSGVALYKENGGYVAGSIVQNGGKRYQCKPYPYNGWCNGAAWAYGPGTGTAWADAWTLLGSCSGVRVAETDLTEVASPSGIAGISNAPNPFTGATEIEVMVSEAGNVSVKIYDLKGIEIATIVEEYMNTGTYNFVYDSSVLKSNMYLLKYNSASGSIVKKIIKTE
jgi:hypothetical protein